MLEQFGLGTKESPRIKFFIKENTPESPRENFTLKADGSLICSCCQEIFLDGKSAVEHWKAKPTKVRAIETKIISCNPYIISSTDKLSLAKIGSEKLSTKI